MKHTEDCVEIIRQLLVSFPELIESDSKLTEDELSDLFHSLRDQILASSQIREKYIKNDWGK